MAYTSPVLTKIECGYVQIEEVALFLTHAWKNSVSLYRRSRLTEMGGKPVIAITWQLPPTEKKEIIFQLQISDLQIDYKPGRHLVVSVTRLRAFDKNTVKQSVEPDIVYINQTEK